MKKVWQRTAFFLCAVAVLSISIGGCRKDNRREEQNGKVSYERLKKNFPVEKNGKLMVWYVDDADGQFLQEASEAFEEKYSIGIVCVQKGETGYLEQLKKSTEDGKGPDLYLLPNGQLKESQLSGLAKPVTLFTEEFLEENYPQTAIDAVSLKEGVYGYPLYFDTWFLLYNSNYIKKIPVTFDAMLDYGEEFSDERDNTNLFKWDLTNPYVNFMFLGNQLEIFGKTGDDGTKFKINKAGTIEAMQYFQELSNFPVGTMKTANYKTVLESVQQREALFAICKTDVIKEIGKNSPYSVALLPDLTKQMKAQGLSITQLAVVNENTEQPNAAELFASYLSYEYANQQYDTAGKLSAKKGIYYEDERLEVVYRQYERSIPVPKAVEMKAFWNYISIANVNIWNGATVSKQLDDVQKKMEALIQMD